MILGGGEPEQRISIVSNTGLCVVLQRGGGGWVGGGVGIKFLVGQNASPPLGNLGWRDSIMAILF